mgnify:CR=1 FL=1
MSLLKATVYVLFTLYLAMQYPSLAVLFVFVKIVMISRHLNNDFSEEVTVETILAVGAVAEDKDDPFYIVNPLHRGQGQDGGY